MAVTVLDLEKNLPKRYLLPRKINVKHNATMIFVSMVKNAKKRKRVPEIR